MATNVIKQTIDALRAKHPSQTVFHRDDIVAAARTLELSWNDINDHLLNTRFRASRGLYDISAAELALSGGPATVAAAVPQDPVPQDPVPQVQATQAPAPAATFNLAQAVNSVMNDEVYVPEVDSTYVRWGEYETVLKAISSGMFFPIFISGLSGNGKTKMVEQCCAKLKREYIRVQISPETDEDDLIGGFRLLNGETVFCKGPVIKAMERGCLLLIDEIDRGSNKIMCLQGVLEGNPVLIKKTGQVVNPAAGFNVIATANTKGRGSDDGRFAAATIIDEAFLERFVATIEQPYAPKNTEKRIVLKHMEKFGHVDEDFASKLVDWSEVIRKTYEQDAIEELISTRRLCHIAKSFAIYRDRQHAINLCISRFDSDTKNAFLDLYSKIDPTITPAATPAPANESATNATSTPAVEA